MSIITPTSREVNDGAYAYRPDRLMQAAAARFHKHSEQPVIQHPFDTSPEISRSRSLSMYRQTLSMQWMTRLATVADGLMIGTSLLLLPLRDDVRAGASTYYFFFAVWLLCTTISSVLHGTRCGHPKLHILGTLAVLLLLCIIMLHNPGVSLEGLIPFFPLLTTFGGLFVAFIASRFSGPQGREGELPRHYRHEPHNHEYR